MEIGNYTPDGEVLAELASRLRRKRIELELTQTELAYEASLSVDTVARAENSGEAGLKALVRILRALRSLSELDRVLLHPPVDPIEMVARAEQQRRRVRHPAKKAEQDKGKGWVWGE